MACNPDVLKQVPLFALLDDEETAVLAGQVELKRFAPRQRIYKMGDPGGRAYVMISGRVRVTTVDEDHQEVVVDEPAAGEFFGFASMLDQTAHQTAAIAVDEAVCVEVDRNDIAVLLQRKPLAGMDMLTVLGRQFHASQQLVRLRSTRNANEVIEQKTTFGDRVADAVARFGGSWFFIISFGVVLAIYQRKTGPLGLGSLSVHPAQPVPVHAGGNTGARHHDESESPGHKGPRAWRTGLRCEPPCGIRDSEPGTQAQSAWREDG